MVTVIVNAESFSHAVKKSFHGKTGEACALLGPSGGPERLTLATRGGYSEDARAEKHIHIRNYK